MRNIYTKFYLLAIVVLGAIMLGLYAQYAHSRALVYDNAQKIAGVSVSVLKEQIDGWLSEKARVVDDAGRVIGMKRWNNEETLAYLKVLLRNNPAFASLYYGSTDNVMTNASGWVPPPTFDLRTRPWYVKALAENRLIITETFVNASKDDLIVTIAQPVYSQDGVLLGVIAGDVSVRTVMTLVRDKKIGENGFSFLVDGNKKMLAHPDYQYALSSGAPALDEDYLNFTKLAAQTRNGVINYSMRGREGFVAYQRVENTSWMLGSFISLGDFIKAEEQMTWGFMLALGVSIVILFVLFVLLARFVIAPLIRLNESVGRIDMETLSEYRVPVSGSDEFAMVSRTFNKIIDKADAYLIQVRADEAELKTRGEELRRNVEIQGVLREIAEVAVKESTMEEFYATVHHAVGRILPAKNFFIAMLDEKRDQILVPYCVDEMQAIPKNRPKGKGLTEYVMQTSKAVYLSSEELKKLYGAGEVANLHLSPIREWMGAPLCDGQGKPFGVIAQFSTEEALVQGNNDLEVLAIVAAQISLAIRRKQAEEELKEANENLERKVEERTQELQAVNQELTAQNEEMMSMNEEIASLNQSLTGLNEELEQRVVERNADLTAAHEELSVQYGELVESQAAQRRNAEIQAVLREIADAAVVAVSLDELYAKVHQSVGRVLPVKNFLICLMDKLSGDIVMPYCVAENNVIPTRRPIGKGMTEYVMRQGKAVHLTSTDFQAICQAGEIELRFQQFSEWLGAPLQSLNGEFSGILAIFSIGKEPPYTSESIEAISIIASQVSTAIERMQAEEALRNTGEHLNKLIQYASAPIIVLNPEYIIIRFNKASEHLTGYAKDEVIGKPMSMLIAEGAWNEAIELIEQSRSGMNCESVEIPVRRKNGEDRIVLWSFANIYAADATTLTAIIAQGQDVTDRVRREQEINRDAKMATRVQNALLSMPETSEYIDITTLCKPFSYVGGDLYFMDWRYEGSMLRGFLVDATGHGLSTALHTTSLHVLLREVNDLDLPLADAMQWLNRRASEYFDEGIFAGAQGFELDLQVRELRWICAGIPKVWMATKNRQGASDCPGMCLGISDDETFNTHTIPVDVGDSLYFVTHGLADLLDGRENLPLNRYAEMVDMLRVLSEDKDRRDDSTAVCIHVRSLPQSLIRQDGWPRIIRFNGYGDYQRLKGEVAKILEEVTGQAHSLQEVAVNEAIANALECRDGQARSQKARVKFNKIGNRLIVRVKTSRIGFAGNAILRRLRANPENMFSFGEDAAMGRGIPMMLTMSYKMTYNSDGTEVLLAWKL